MDKKKIVFVGDIFNNDLNRVVPNVFLGVAIYSKDVGVELLKHER